MPFTISRTLKATNIGWIGDIPSAWTLKKIKFVLMEKVSIKASDLQSGSISFGEVVEKDDESIPIETKNSYQEVNAGEFLINPINLNYDLKSLRTALSKIDVCVSPAYIVAQLVDEGCDKSFLKYLMYQFDVSHMKTLGAGVRQTITFKDIGDCFIPLPPIEEQKTIALYLDSQIEKIDNLIKLQEQLAIHSIEKRRAIINQAVTKGLASSIEMKESGFEWLGAVPKHWQIKPLKYLGKIISGYAFKSEDFTDSGVRVLKIANIQTDYLDWTDDSYLPESFYDRHRDFAVKNNDVVFALTRPIISSGLKAAIATIDDEKVLLNQRNAIFRPSEELDNNYLYYFLFSESFKCDFENKIDFTGQQPNISAVDIGNIKILLPPIFEQKEIALHLKDQLIKVDELVKKSRHSVELLKEHRASLISALVTGKIDVKNLVN